VIARHAGGNSTQSRYFRQGIPPENSTFRATAIVPEEDEEELDLSNNGHALQRYERSPSPRVYLDDSVLDRFSALPIDLPPEVVTEQLYNCKNPIAVGRMPRN
jgi:hypothetical protein